MAIHSVITLTFNFNPHLVDKEECVIIVQTKDTKGLAVKNTQFYIDFVHWKNTFCSNRGTFTHSHCCEMFPRKNWFIVHFIVYQVSCNFVTVKTPSQRKIRSNM